MEPSEFNHWADNFREVLQILKERDPVSADDLRNNVIINSMKRTIKYIGVNRGLAACFLPPSCLPYEKNKWSRNRGMKY